MQAVQAIGTMVPMVAASSFWNNKSAAYLTGKGIVAGMGFKVPFLVLLSFIFSIQVYFLLKAVFNLWEDLRRLYYTQTSRFSAISIVPCIKHTPTTINFKIPFPALRKTPLETSSLSYHRYLFLATFFFFQEQLEKHLSFSLKISPESKNSAATLGIAMSPLKLSHRFQTASKPS